MQAGPGFIEPGLVRPAALLGQGHGRAAPAFVPLYFNGENAVSFTRVKTINVMTAAAIT